MEFNKQLTSGRLIKRYKRFLADIRLEDGSLITAHCPNSGSMKGCQGENWPVMLSKSANPKRKYSYTWEMVHNGTCWIGINTHLANHIVKEAIELGRIDELRGYSNIKPEVKYGRNSRIDLLLSRENSSCYVEIKNVTLVENGNYQFPDAVTTRGKKHLQELQDVVRSGARAVMFFLVQRSDGAIFKPAEHIDPAYSQELKRAFQNGVEILVYRAEIAPQKIEITEKIEYKIYD